jgi:hypothetical protein
MALSIQDQFIEVLQKQIGVRRNLADELSDSLGISKDSAYRRLRNETAFTIDEMAVLCRKYQVSFDAFNSSQQNLVTFTYPRMYNRAENITDYMESVCASLRFVADNKGEVTYAAEDVPVISSLRSDALARFKLFYWNKSVLSNPDYRSEKFSKGLIDGKLLALAQEINDHYNKIPSTEIWTEDTLKSTLMQIQYFWKAGIFKDKDDALEILHALREMVEHLNLQAEFGHKSGKFVEDDQKNFVLFNCEVLVGNNCVRLQTEGQTVSVISFNSFNTLTTTNPHFNDEINSWLVNLMKKSNQISDVSDIQRFQFFKQLFSQIDESIEAIG